MIYYDPFWGEIKTFFNFVPKGYELIETPEHKQERLRQSLQEKKASVEYLTKRLTELSSEIESEEKQLLALSPPDTE